MHMCVYIYIYIYIYICLCKNAPAEKRTLGKRGALGARQGAVSFVCLLLSYD